jgi:hypothetical protein
MSRKCLTSLQKVTREKQALIVHRTKDTGTKAEWKVSSLKYEKYREKRRIPYSLSRESYSPEPTTLSLEIYSQGSVFPLTISMQHTRADCMNPTASLRRTKCTWVGASSWITQVVMYTLNTR